MGTDWWIDKATIGLFSDSGMVGYCVNIYMFFFFSAPESSFCLFSQAIDMHDVGPNHYDLCNRAGV